MWQTTFSYFSKNNGPRMNVTMNLHQAVLPLKNEGKFLRASLYFPCPNAAILCIDCSTRVEIQPHRSPKNSREMINHQPFCWENNLQMWVVVVCPYQPSLGYGGSCIGSSALCFWVLFGWCCKNSLTVAKLQMLYFI